MNSIRPWLVGVAALLLAAGALAEVTVSGVKFEDGADVRGSKVQLNGAGVR